MNQPIHLSIDGMKCASCVTKVEKVLENLAGVQEVRINLASKEGWVTAEEDFSPPEILQAVKSVGFSASLIEGMESAPKKRATSEGIYFLSALILTLPLMIISMGRIEVPGKSWILLVVSAVVVFGLGAKFFKNALIRARYFSADMDTLIALGTLSAFSYSAYLMSQGQKEFYFESAATIVTLILLGRFLEARALGKSGDALEKLLAQSPKKATLIEDEGEREVAVEIVQQGDLVLIRPGEKIPVDGIIEEGEGYVDESMFSGESVPLSMGPGDSLKAGTLSQDGAFRVRASAEVSQSYFSQVVRLVQLAQSSKPPVQRLADKIAGVFVPIVLFISLLTFFLHIFLAGATAIVALTPAICVLLIACPCTLGLATPVAIVVSMGKAAQFGVVIRDATYLEALTKINCVALDKTGTITEGKPKLQAIYPGPSWKEEDILLLSAALEKNSEHPLGRAIVEAAGEKKLQEVESFQYFPGKGISAKINDKVFYLGQQNFLEERGIQRGTWMEDLEKSRGNTLLFLADKQEVIAVLALWDGPRKTSAQAISAIQSLGIQVVMMTGDSPEAAEAIAKEVGITQVFAGLLPHEKLEKLEELKKTHRVAMVGDGINDAPSLSAAHVGIGVASGTEVALESADIVLASSNLLDVFSVISLAKKTMITIRENLFFAFFYNGLALPVAALGFLTPMIAAGAMALSSVSVVTNSNRLRNWKNTTLKR